ncbi:MAG: type II toxin-antitoxin system VapC family toxin [Candidatus Bathyarchaeia archaeon]
MRRRVQSGEIGWAQLRDRIGSFLDEVHRNFRIERVNEGIADALEHKHGLSTLDSLQLASAIRASEAVGAGGILFIPADEELCKAAGREGFEAINQEG